jgi:hypothetical protein
MIRTIALASVIAFTGCCGSGLQKEYVGAMEATRRAVEADVDAGLYKPDARSRATLDRWKAANDDAAAALLADQE